MNYFLLAQDRFNPPYVIEMEGESEGSFLVEINTLAGKLPRSETDPIYSMFHPLALIDRQDGRTLNFVLADNPDSEGTLERLYVYDEESLSEYEFALIHRRKAYMDSSLGIEWNPDWEQTVSPIQGSTYSGAVSAATTPASLEEIIPLFLYNKDSDVVMSITHTDSDGWGISPSPIMTVG